MPTNSTNPLSLYSITTANPTQRITPYAPQKTEELKKTLEDAYEAYKDFGWNNDLSYAETMKSYNNSKMEKAAKKFAMWAAGILIASWITYWTVKAVEAGVFDTKTEQHVPIQALSETTQPKTTAIATPTDTLGTQENPELEAATSALEKAYKHSVGNRPNPEIAAEKFKEAMANFINAGWNDQTLDWTYPALTAKVSQAVAEAKAKTTTEEIKTEKTAVVASTWGKKENTETVENADPFADYEGSITQEDVDANRERMMKERKVRAKSMILKWITDEAILNTDPLAKKEALTKIRKELGVDANWKKIEKN